MLSGGCGLEKRNGTIKAHSPKRIGTSCWVIARLIQPLRIQSGLSANCFCKAVCDVPPAAFAEELIATYPDAKVVILNRDVDKWYTSVSQTVLRVAKPTAWSTLLGLLDWRETGQFSKMLDQQMRGMFGPAGLTEDNMKRFFIDYHENLRRIVPRERLLEYKVQDGYGPLCNFLGVPVPTREVEGKEVEEPFPRVNDSSAFMEKIAVRDRQRNRRILRETGKFLSVVVLIGTGLWYLWGP